MGLLPQKKSGMAEVSCQLTMCHCHRQGQTQVQLLQLIPDVARSRMRFFSPSYGRTPLLFCQFHHSPIAAMVLVVVAHSDHGSVVEHTEGQVGPTDGHDAELTPPPDPGVVTSLW